MIRVLEPGFKTTIQDMGRHGYYHLGVPPCGAADKLSFQVGNYLLGNPSNCAALEITLLGPRIEMQKHTVIAITGAPAEVFLNEQPIQMWEAIEVQSGDMIRFQYSEDRVGVFTYLCVSGGINTPEMLGSRSAYTLSDFGGLLSRSLYKGDVIEISEPLPGVFNQIGKRVSSHLIPAFSNKVDVHAVIGLTSHLVSDEGMRRFLNNEWEVNLESNRVAYRLKGESMIYQDYERPFGAGGSAGSVVDFAYPIGAILVPNPEEMIVLLNDATVGGGFVTLGTVISSDLSYLAQARPASLIRFHAVTVSQAIELRFQQQKKLTELMEMLK